MFTHTYSYIPEICWLKGFGQEGAGCFRAFALLSHRPPIANTSVVPTRSARKAPASPAPCDTALATAADVGPAPWDVLACADGYVCSCFSWLHAVLASRPTQFIIAEALPGNGGIGSAAPSGDDDFLRRLNPGLASPSGALVAAGPSSTAPDDVFASSAGSAPTSGDAVATARTADGCAAPAAPGFATACLPAASFTLACGSVRGLCSARRKAASHRPLSGGAAPEISITCSPARVRASRSSDSDVFHFGSAASAAPGSATACSRAAGVTLGCGPIQLPASWRWRRARTLVHACSRSGLFVRQR